MPLAPVSLTASHRAEFLMLAYSLKFGLAVLAGTFA
jgi:hypothetical protein